MSLTQNRKVERAFTLPEITLTLGLVSFVLIPLIGLTALVSKNSFNADTAVVSSAIATALFGDAQQATQEQVDLWITGGPVDRYYDIHGVEIDSSSDSIFTARLIVKDGGVELGGGNNEYITNVIVQVCSFVGEAGTERLDEVATDFDVPQRGVRTYRTVLANLEKSRR